MSTLERDRAARATHPVPQSPRPFKLIGELINNSFAQRHGRGRTATSPAYQQLAKLQAELGADYLTLNIDGTQSMRSRRRKCTISCPT